MVPSSRFGNFVLHERLAVGGMGELFLASHVDRPDQPLALKILLKEFRNREDFVSMFRDEARIGMRLAHKNIVGVQEIGELDGVPYILMEYVHGENLRAVLRGLFMARETFPPELAVKVAIEVLEGLDHAHRARDENGHRLRLVHRDLSPDNILLSYEGEVKILDFGIAKAEGRSTETQFGVLKGKAQYMPPEQANGRAVDARSDLFALGVVMLEVLTGEKRFKSEDPMQQYVEARAWTPTAPSTKVKGVPPELDVALLKAMQQEPSRRWQNADEFSSALTRLLRSGTLPKSPWTLRSLLQRLFPETAAKAAIEGQPARESTSSGVVVEVNATSAVATAIDPDLSAPPRWANEDEESGAIPQSTNLAEVEATRLGPGAAVAMHAAEEPRRPQDTRVSAKNLADEAAAPRVRVAEAPIPAHTGSGAATLPGAPPPLRNPAFERPTRDTAAPIGALGPARLPQPVDPSRITGPLFPHRPKSASPGGALAAIAAVVVIGIAAIAMWKLRERPASHGPTLAGLDYESGRLAFDVPEQTPTPLMADVSPVPSPTPRFIAVRPTAVLKLTSKPSGAAIWVDGHNSGKKTPATIALKPGSHKLSLGVRGYRTWTWSDTVYAGDTIPLKATLKKR